MTSTPALRIKCLTFTLRFENTFARPMITFSVMLRSKKSLSREVFKRKNVQRLFEAMTNVTKHILLSKIFKNYV